MVLSYIFEGEHYPYRIEENAEDLQEFIEHVANKRDVIIDGKASDIWKLLVDLDILDTILKDDRFEDFLNTKYKEKAYEDFLEYKEVMGESVEPEKNTRGKSKGEQIAQIVADLINKNGGIGPFGREKVTPKGNTLHLYSQSPEEIYRFNDDGSVDFTNIEDLLMDSSNWDDYGIEDEEEAEWVIKEYSHWKSVEELIDSSILWFYDLEGEEQALAEIDKVLKDHGEVVEEAVSTLGRKRDAKGRFASIKPAYDDIKNAHFLTEAKADIEKFKSWLNDDNLFNLYYKLAPRLKAPYKDIYWIMKNSTKEDLKSYLDELDSTKSRSEIKKEDLEGAKLVAENSSYKCYHITTYKASVIMGRGTKWCISMKNNSSYWKSYTSKGIKFYFFIGKNEKLALALYPEKITVDYTDIDPHSDLGVLITNFELFNEKDETISYKISEYNLPQIPGVELVYKDALKNLDENGLYIEDNVVVMADKNLTEVTIPEGVTKIGKSAFKYCYSLENVKLPKSLLSIGDSAFFHCRSLTSVVIPDSVTTIGSSAFYGCRNLTDIEIPNSVKTIGNGAFSNCSSLTSVVIPNSVTNIGDDAFNNCINLTSMEIPSSVKTIGGYAFHGCSSLTSVVIPNSVTTIGRYAFTECRNLINIEIPNSVTTIGDSAFSNCSSLTSVVIPNSVKTIGDYAFSDCDKLTGIEIPSSVTIIGRFAFLDCNNLTIYCEATSQPSGWNSGWNSDNRPVVWGYKGDKLEEAKSSKPLKLYKYTGRAFNFEHELPIQSEYYVHAVSEKQALNNLRARIAKEMDRDIKRFLVTLEDDKLKEVKPEEQAKDEKHFEKKFCDKHSKPVPLTDSGYCPICDDGIDESEYFAESFKVDNSVILDLISEFEKAYKYYLNDFYFSDDTLEIVVRGDWKHDHVFIDFALPRFAKEKYNIDLIQKDTIEHENSDYADSDDYIATHVFKVM